MLLAGYEAEAVLVATSEAEYTYAMLHLGAFVIIENRLYRRVDGQLKEIIRPIDRLDVLRRLHETLGHVGIQKLYH